MPGANPSHSSRDGAKADCEMLYFPAPSTLPMCDNRGTEHHMKQTPNTLPTFTPEQFEKAREIINNPDHPAWPELHARAAELNRQRKENDEKQANRD